MCKLPRAHGARGYVMRLHVCQHVIVVMVSMKTARPGDWVSCKTANVMPFAANSACWLGALSMCTNCLYGGLICRLVFVAVAGRISSCGRFSFPVPCCSFSISKMVRGIMQGIFTMLVEVQAHCVTWLLLENVFGFFGDMQLRILCM